MASDDDLLLLLKTQGPLTTGAVASRLGITVQGARQRLERLAARGLTEARPERAGIGRPRACWSLGPAAAARFPDAHDQVAVELIEGIREELGEAALERLIARREAAQRQRYLATLAAESDLARRVARLAEERSREGYMAEVRREGEDLLLVEHHCPICAAARACQGFCRAELALFRLVLSPLATVEREAHLLAGEARCVYRIRPVRETAGRPPSPSD